VEENLSTEDEETARRLIAQKSGDGNVVVLDDFIKSNNIIGLGFKGANFPLFDISSTTEICSVASRGSIEGYIRKFCAMFNKINVKKAAENFYNLAQVGCPVPSLLCGQPIEEYEKFLKENSVFRIPENHYLGIRNVIADYIAGFPGNYWLKKETTSDEIILFVQKRIQSSGYNYGVELKEEKLTRLFRISAERT
jgi:hypothetical protein